MLFLLNDAVIEIDPRRIAAPLDPRRFQALGLDAVLRLGQELFAETPLLHRTQPERARRLAWLLNAKAPEMNAALFAAPSAGCDPGQVAVRYVALSVDVVAALHMRSRQGTLTPQSADAAVWRRLAA